jgi:hypothetical protein
MGALSYMNRVSLGCLGRIGQTTQLLWVLRSPTQANSNYRLRHCNRRKHPHHEHPDKQSSLYNKSISPAHSYCPESDPVSPHSRHISALTEIFSVSPCHILTLGPSRPAISRPQSATWNYRSTVVGLIPSYMKSRMVSTWTYAAPRWRRIKGNIHLRLRVLQIARHDMLVIPGRPWDMSQTSQREALSVFPLHNAEDCLGIQLGEDRQTCRMASLLGD